MYDYIVELSYNKVYVRSVNDHIKSFQEHQSEDTQKSTLQKIKIISKRLLTFEFITSYFPKNYNDLEKVQDTKFYKKHFLEKIKDNIVNISSKIAKVLAVPTVLLIPYWSIPISLPIASLGFGTIYISEKSRIIKDNIFIEIHPEKYNKILKEIAQKYQFHFISERETETQCMIRFGIKNPRRHLKNDDIDSMTFDKHVDTRFKNFLKMIPNNVFVNKLFKYEFISDLKNNTNNTSIPNNTNNSNKRITHSSRLNVDPSNYITVFSFSTGDSRYSLLPHEKKMIKYSEINKKNYENIIGNIKPSFQKIFKDMLLGSNFRDDEKLSPSQLSYYLWYLKYPQEKLSKDDVKNSIGFFAKKHDQEIIDINNGKIKLQIFNNLYLVKKIDEMLEDLPKMFIIDKIVRPLESIKHLDCGYHEVYPITKCTLPRNLHTKTDTILAKKVIIREKGYTYWLKTLATFKVNWRNKD